MRCLVSDPSGQLRVEKEVLKAAASAADCRLRSDRDSIRGPAAFSIDNGGKQYPCLWSTHLLRPDMRIDMTRPSAVRP